ncbi:hypothetical protein H5410_050846 [Solanum commersonii]|uniref:Uncharacterized protein n=1 Tax=Solanum commersonii TaxID=4109 RepID=A0A9J5WWP2_SOLCO|nr:hypothetical protein H5410_050846 [Solanum commersonii]
MRIGKPTLVTLDDEYEGLDYSNIDEVDAMTSSEQPVITVQLREPLTVQTYIPRVVVITLIAKKPQYDTKTVPWDYRAGANHPIHSINSIPVTDELDEATFHTLEIMQAVRVNEEAEPNDTKLLRHEPTSGRDQHGSSKTIFVLEQTSIPYQASDDDIIEGIGNLFMAMVGEEKEIHLNKLTIRDVEPREIFKN